jgi:polyvinyl alcohol dehydrogenase (cytochrome)
VAHSCDTPRRPSISNETNLALYALDAKSGCTLWTYSMEAAVRTAVTFGPLSGTDQFALFFGGVRANVHAINATTGALIWKQEGTPMAC